MHLSDLKLPLLIFGFLLPFLLSLRAAELSMRIQYEKLMDLAGEGCLLPFIDPLALQNVLEGLDIDVLNRTELFWDKWQAKVRVPTEIVAAVVLTTFFYYVMLAVVTVFVVKAFRGGVKKGGDTKRYIVKKVEKGLQQC